MGISDSMEKFLDPESHPEKKKTIMVHLISSPVWKGKSSEPSTFIASWLWVPAVHFQGEPWHDMTFAQEPLVWLILDRLWRVLQSAKSNQLSPCFLFGLESLFLKMDWYGTPGFFFNVWLFFNTFHTSLTIVFQLYLHFHRDSRLKDSQKFKLYLFPPAGWGNMTNE